MSKLNIADGGPSPETSANFLSRLLMTYLDPLLHLGFKRPLESSDIWDLPDHYKSKKLGDAYQQVWDREYQRAKDKLGTQPPSKSGTDNDEETRLRKLRPHLKTLWSFGGRMFLAGAVPRFAADSCQLAGPIVLLYLIRHLNGAYKGTSWDEPWYGYVMACILFLLQVTQTLSFARHFDLTVKLGYKLRTGLIAVNFRKMLRLSPAARNRLTSGKIINVIVSDTNRIDLAMQTLPNLYSAPYLIVVAAGLLIWTLGASALIGLGVLLLYLPCQNFVQATMSRMRTRANKIADERIRITSESLSGVRVIKAYAWEPSFRKTIEDLRKRELTFTRVYLLLRSCISGMSQVIPAMAMVVTYVAFERIGGGLDPGVVFSSLSLFYVLRSPLLMIPLTISQATDAWIAMERIEQVLIAEELTDGPLMLPYAPSSPNPAAPAPDADMDPDVAIEIRDAEFMWAESKAPAAAGDGKGDAAKSPTKSPEKSSSKGVASVRVEEDGGPASPTTVDGSSAQAGFTLRVPHLALRRGTLTAVIGAVGAGKSSFLQALVGEMKRTSGGVKIRGSLGWCPQQAWVLNQTVKGNVLFGKEWEDDRYKQVVGECALEKDLKILPAGDMTEIGERGINLSGGQKQRLSLARAVYFGADVILLDDPLSAVDAHVGRYLFDHCIQGALSNRTRVLVTHQLHFLPRCDRILLVDNGRIIEDGTFEELMAREGSVTKKMMEEFGGMEDDESEGENAVEEVAKPVEEVQEKKEEKSLDVREIRFADEVADSKDAEEKEAEPSTKENGSGTDAPFLLAKDAAPADTSLSQRLSKSNLNPSKKTSASSLKKSEDPDAAAGGESEAARRKRGRLMTAEERAVGTVTFATFQEYIVQGGGAIMMILVLTSAFAAQVARVMTDNWLAFWSSRRYDLPSATYQGVYFALGLSQAVFLVVFAFALVYAGLWASQNMHALAVGKVLKAPVAFFDTTPLGRLITRFSRDVDMMDNTLPETYRTVLFTLTMTLCNFAQIAAIFPAFLGGLLPALVLFYFFQRYYSSSTREVRRLDSVSRSAVFAHVSETLTGLATIRAYARQAMFTAQNLTLLDANGRMYYASVLMPIWLSIRLEAISAILILLSGVFAVVYRYTTSPGIAGLTISYAINITNVFQWCVRQTAELEQNMNSVERLGFLIHDIPQEQDVVGENGEKGGPVVVTPPPSEWPSKGTIEFDSVEMRYRPELPLVLKGINFTIKAGEKCGIVGRTGAGKSSILVALLRLVENASGAVRIDGFDISRVSQARLRSSIAVIPQDPVLFSGTIRSNLDPFSEYPGAYKAFCVRVVILCSHESVDDALWRALEKADLKTVVSASPLGLEMVVAENGENFSTGQRQLLCLARAMLKSSKIILLDEATASVDLATDDFIQKAIRESFSDATVITIAHRLNTVADYTKILVLSSGVVIEEGSPKELLEKEDGSFSKMVEETGPANAAAIRAIAGARPLGAGDDVAEVSK
ncbi:Multidrug resistance-associated protein 1 [Phlyctochytrium bullatum]|nr:Multidrug resistance-associated protein 1 [Phlyctochytrium bullatum]